MMSLQGLQKHDMHHDCRSIMSPSVQIKGGEGRRWTECETQNLDISIILNVSKPSKPSRLDVTGLSSTFSHTTQSGSVMAHDLQVLQLHAAMCLDALSHPLCTEDGADKGEAQKDDAHLGEVFDQEIATKSHHQKLSFQTPREKGTFANANTPLSQTI